MKVCWWPRVDGFIVSLPDCSAQLFLLGKLENLEKYGLYNFRKSGDSVYIGDGIDEIKIKFDGMEYRFLCTLFRGDCWILHALIKKSRKLKQNNKGIAKKRKRELENYYNKR